MTRKVLFHAKPEDWTEYREVLPAAIQKAGIVAEVAPDIPLSEADYMVYAPYDGALDFSGAGRLRAVLSLWAGVERIVDDVPRQIPLARMVDHGLTRGMVEYCVGHVMRHHLGMDAHIHNPDNRWDYFVPPLAEERPVTVLGMGALGQATARALAALGFAVTGWSRSLREMEGVRCLAGAETLEEALAEAQIVVLLLPSTRDTENTLNKDTLAVLPRGAVVINPGRGALIDDDALLEALSSGQVGHATLDTFQVEPLPADHPYWRHPRVTITPHNASATRPRTASQVIAENIARSEAGERLLHLVDREAGY